jgi:hypothetical protein
VLERRRQSEPAFLIRDIAEEFENALRQQTMEVLTLAEAAAEGGYSTEHLGRLLRKNPELNAGRKGAPRILRRDVPRKPDASAIGPRACLSVSSSPGAAERRAARARGDRGG